jgi:hypothetical protein
MRRRLVAVVLAAVMVALALSAEASAGPPPSCFRAKTRCDLTYYEAAQALYTTVLQKLRPRLTAAFGSSEDCGPTEHRSPGFARCTLTIEQGGLLAPCTVEALLSRRKGAPWRVRWWKESQSCELDMGAH